MKDFNFQCANCAKNQRVFVKTGWNSKGGDNKALREFKADLEAQITELGWIKMLPSDIPGFHEFLCPICK